MLLYFGVGVMYLRLFSGPSVSNAVRCNIVIFTVCGVFSMLGRFVWSLVVQFPGPKSSLEHNLEYNGYTYPAIYTGMLFVSELVPVLYYVIVVMHQAKKTVVQRIDGEDDNTGHYSSPVLTI